jgi:hypothetical protein
MASPEVLLLRGTRIVRSRTAASLREIKVGAGRDGTVRGMLPFTPAQFRAVFAAPAALHRPWPA